MIQMIPLFTNGNIALRTEIKIEQGPVAISLTCKAKEIHTIQKGLPDSIFRYPKGHSIQRNEESQKASFFTPIFLLQNP